MFKCLQKTFAYATAILLSAILIACGTIPIAESQSTIASSAGASSSLPVAYTDKELSASPAKLPLLAYDNTALSKAIDAETMKLHHDGHHAAYVNNLNDALKKYPNLQKRTGLTQLAQAIAKI